jgi:hypothetical protein
MSGARFPLVLSRFCAREGGKEGKERGSEGGREKIANGKFLKNGNL